MKQTEKKKVFFLAVSLFSLLLSLLLPLLLHLHLLSFLPFLSFPLSLFLLLVEGACASSCRGRLRALNDVMAKNGAICAIFGDKQKIYAVCA